MVDSVKIEGETKVGAVLVAVTDYWGGTQGPSSYKWIRVKGGIDEKVKKGFKKFCPRLRKHTLHKIKRK